MFTVSVTACTMHIDPVTGEPIWGFNPSPEQIEGIVYLLAEK